MAQCFLLLISVSPQIIMKEGLYVVCRAFCGFISKYITASVARVFKNLFLG